MSKKSTIAKLSASLDIWRQRPAQWVADIFDGKLKLTGQQDKYFRHLTNVIVCKLALHEGRELSPALEKYRSKIGISIMAGRGVGKDFSTALTILWFAMCFPAARVMATGVTGKHLRNVLWAEIGKLQSLSKRLDQDPTSPTFLQQQFEWQSERIINKGDPNVIIEAVTINPKSSEAEQAQSLSGRHADFMMICIDEADGVPTCVMDNLEPTMTGKCNLALMIFNPQTNTSYATKSHDEPSKWVRLRWNAEDSEVVSKDFIESYARHGKDSNAYRVNVLGLPPLSDDGGLIPWQWLQECKNLELDTEAEPIIYGVDVGFGGDATVICKRQGNKVLEFARYNSKDDIPFFIMKHMEEDNAAVAVIDVVGVGANVMSEIRRAGYNVKPYMSQSASTNPERFKNKRSEAFFILRQLFQDRAISIPDDSKLIEQLAYIKCNPQQKNQIQDKRSIRQGLGYSPDEADAMSMAFSVDGRLYKKGANLSGTTVNWKGVFLR